MLPIRDHNPTHNPIFVTYIIIVMNAMVWLLFQGAGGHEKLVSSICEWGFVPAAFTLENYVQWPSQYCSGPPPNPELGLFSSMFMHGSWFHIAGNMWFLHVFGNNIEDRLGAFKFLLLYLISGIAAAALQMYFSPESATPMVGASGAIGGVMGAYMVFFPKVGIDTFVIFGFFWRMIRIPAYFMLGYWFLFQMIGGSFDIAKSGGGVAYWAHVGGFGAGFVLAYLLGKVR